MNFLLEINSDDLMIYILLAIGAVLAIAFYIRSRKSAENNVSSDDSNNNLNLVEETSQPDQDEEIIAVIAAAIAMAESENSGLKFKVVSFRRI